MFQLDDGIEEEKTIKIIMTVFICTMNGALGLLLVYVYVREVIFENADSLQRVSGAAKHLKKSVHIRTSKLRQRASSISVKTLRRLTPRSQNRKKENEKDNDQTGQENKESKEVELTKIEIGPGTRDDRTSSLDDISS